MTERNVPLHAVELASELQTRVEVSAETIAEYAAAYRDGVELPRIVVCQLPDGELLAIDGFHRIQAAVQAGKDWLPARVVEVDTRLDALWLALSQNHAHGLKRSRADKRRAVELALSHPDAEELSDRQLAKHCGVHHELVASVRQAQVSRTGVADPPRRTDSRGRQQPARRGGSATSTPNTAKSCDRESPRSAPPEPAPPAEARTSATSAPAAALRQSPVDAFNQALAEAADAQRGARLLFASLGRRFPEHEKLFRRAADLAKQVEADFELAKLAECPGCDGSGCTFCSGRGIVEARSAEQHKRVEARR